MNNVVYDSKFQDKCNRAFSVDITPNHFPFVFDVYDTKEELEEATGESFFELSDMDCAKIIDDKFVIINFRYLD